MAGKKSRAKGTAKKAGRKKETAKQTHEVRELAARYGLALLLGLNNLWVFYFLFLPLTLFPVAGILSIFYHLSLAEKSISIAPKAIEITDACVAGAAYYLLALLILTTRNIPRRTRMNMFAFGAFILLIINIIRILILSGMYLNDAASFEITHQIFWFALSTLAVVLIWIFTARAFRIQSIPVYSDMKFLVEQAWGKKRK